MPVIDEEGNLVAVHFWEDFFGFKEREDRQSINLPVVIMAGGKGTATKFPSSSITGIHSALKDKTLALICSKESPTQAYCLFLSVNAFLEY